jgi:hypothetical protein
VVIQLAVWTSTLMMVVHTPPKRVGVKMIQQRLCVMLCIAVGTCQFTF